MKIWIYAKSSHRDTLDNVRRCSAIANALKEYEPILCSGDYRAASIARDYMGVKNTMGIDAMGNLPHTMERLDILIYDNEDVNEEMRKEMDEFCSKLYAVGETIPYDIVDETYFQKSDSNIEKAVFFGDEDYDRWFVDFCKDSQKHKIPLLNGNYFFLDTQTEFEKSFSEVIDEEEYEQSVKNTKHLLSASIHTALESLASANKPVFFMCKNEPQSTLDILKKYKIPVVQAENLDELLVEFENTINNYPETKKIEMFDFSTIKTQIDSVLEHHKEILPAIDYTYAYGKN
jgi:hypothetical protein